MYENKLIEAAELLKKHCEAHFTVDTCDCIFDDGGACLLCASPKFTRVPKPRRFTDEDIALAKALKALGGDKLDKDSVGWLCSGISTMNGEGTFYLPDGSFKNVRNSPVVILLDEIIAEEQE